MSYYQWKPYVPVARRRAQAKRRMTALAKKGMAIEPVEIEGRKIARTFWGEAWCDHLESYSDFENRLPRGRTYVRNGSVCHLGIKKGKIEAKVSGSEIYEVAVKIKTLPAKQWNDVKRRCAGQIGSLLELLKGDLSGSVMEIVTDRKRGLFPSPNEISFDCDCPDWAGMCKHIAAVMYGIGARLDQSPELLFRLRGVDHVELIDPDAQLDVAVGKGKKGGKRIASADLGDVFGIDLDTDSDAPQPKAVIKRRSAKKKAATKRKKAARKTASAKKKATKSKKVVRVKKKTAKRKPKKKLKQRAK